jgi:tetratricopeptide (TPR) repeat protein
MKFIYILNLIIYINSIPIIHILIKTTEEYSNSYEDLCKEYTNNIMFKLKQTKFTNIDFILCQSAFVDHGNPEHAIVDKCRKNKKTSILKQLEGDDETESFFAFLYPNHYKPNYKLLLHQQNSKFSCSAFQGLGEDDIIFEPLRLPGKDGRIIINWEEDSQNKIHLWDNLSLFLQNNSPEDNFHYPRYSNIVFDNEQYGNYLNINANKKGAMQPKDCLESENLSILDRALNGGIDWACLKLKTCKEPKNLEIIDKTLKEKIDKACIILQACEVEQNINCYEGLIKIDPSDAYAYRKIGKILLEKNFNDEKAWAALDKAIELDPRMGPLYNLNDDLINLYYQALRQFEVGERRARREGKIMGIMNEFKNKKARALRHLYRFKEALSELSGFKDNILGAATRGHIYYELKEYNVSLSYFKKCGVLKIGCTFAFLKKTAETTKELEEFFHSGNKKYHYYLTRFLFDSQSAFNHYLKGNYYVYNIKETFQNRRKYPKDPTDLSMLNPCDRAMGHYEDEVKNNPLFHPAYNMLGYCYLRTKQYDEAIKYFYKSLLLELNEVPYYHLAECYLQKLDYTKALQMLDELVRLSNDKKFGYYKIGETILKQHHNDPFKYLEGIGYFEVADQYENNYVSNNLKANGKLYLISDAIGRLRYFEKSVSGEIALKVTKAIGDLYRYKNYYMSALHYYEKVVTSDRYDAIFSIMITLYNIQNDKYAETLAIHIAQNKLQDNFGYLYYKCLILNDIENLRYCNQSLELKPNNKIVYKLKAKILQDNLFYYQALENINNVAGFKNGMLNKQEVVVLINNAWKKLPEYKDKISNVFINKNKIYFKYGEELLKIGLFSESYEYFSMILKSEGKASYCANKKDKILLIKCLYGMSNYITRDSSLFSSPTKATLKRSQTGHVRHSSVSNPTKASSTHSNTDIPSNPPTKASTTGNANQKDGYKDYNNDDYTRLRSKIFPLNVTK